MNADLAKQLEQGVGQSDERELASRGGETPHEKLTHAAHGLDLSEHRLDDRFAHLIEVAPFGARELVAHAVRRRGGRSIGAGRQGLAMLLPRR